MREAPRHPGPPRAERIASLACWARPLRLRLRPGLPLDQAVAEAFAAQGHKAGYLRLRGIDMARIDYVRPAPAPGHGPVAWYSATERLEPAWLAEAGLHLGRRDGAAFVHGHGLWRGTEEGALRMGHLLGPDCRLGAEVEAVGWGLSGAMLSIEADAETGFSLFAPTAAPSDDLTGGHPAALCALRPHVDLHEGLATVAARHGLARARIEGLGSLVGAAFDDAPGLDSLATEVLVTRGDIDRGRVRIAAAAIGFDGDPVQGVLREGANAVCVTSEMLLIGS